MLLVFKVDFSVAVVSRIASIGGGQARGAGWVAEDGAFRHKQHAVLCHQLGT